jgi:hypothetical protein
MGNCRCDSPVLLVRWIDCVVLHTHFVTYLLL